jgi:hypothetical protein
MCWSVRHCPPTESASIVCRVWRRSIELRGSCAEGITWRDGDWFRLRLGSLRPESALALAGPATRARGRAQGTRGSVARVDADQSARSPPDRRSRQVRRMGSHAGDDERNRRRLRARQLPGRARLPHLARRTGHAADAATKLPGACPGAPRHAHRQAAERARQLPTRLRRLPQRRSGYSAANWASPGGAIGTVSTVGDLARKLSDVHPSALWILRRRRHSTGAHSQAPGRPSSVPRAGIQDEHSQRGWVLPIL